MQRGLERGLQQTSERHEEEMECVVCMNAPRTHVFMPCKHMCVCEACATNVMEQDPALAVAKRCPICRGPAQGTMRVVLS